MARPSPFKISVPDEQLAWIQERVRSARLPPARDLSDDETWKSWGLPVPLATRLRDYWANKYNWRREEKRLNEELNQFTIPIRHHNEDVTIHFLHHRSQDNNAIPLLFLHGWPSSGFEFERVIRQLSNPAPGEQAYHCVAPTLPGFGFSSYPNTPCSPMDMVDIICNLMVALGYERFMAQGGDWGSMVIRMMTVKFPENCVAVHLNLIVTGLPSPIWKPFAFARIAFAGLTGWGLAPYEKRMLGRMQWWLREENGCSAIQSNKPLTLSYSLSDSPLGTLCWMKEKIHFLVGDEFEWTEEESITWAMPHIINGSPGHAEIYKWTAGTGNEAMMKSLSKPIPSTIAFSASIFPNDVMYTPRWWAQGMIAHNITFWREHYDGGHFPCYELPSIMAADIREFTKTLDKNVMDSLASTTANTL